MKVVFLCGGIGKRMFPIKKDKCLIEFIGKPLLQHHIEWAKAFGFNDFVIVGNSTNIPKIKNLCQRIGLKVDLFIQDSPLGMADALLKAKDKISDDEILVVNPNDIFSPSLYQSILEETENKEYSSFISAHKVTSYFPGGYLIVNSKLELSKIHEKPGQGNEPSDLVNIVVHLHREPNRLLKQIERTRSSHDDVYESALTKMIKEGHKAKVVEYDGPWIAIKYPWHILDVTEYFLRSLGGSQISKSASISDKAVIKGNAFIGNEVQVLEGAVIKGPCYIGNNTIIGNNCLIRDYTQIGYNCGVGFSTEIARSYIGNDCLFHSNYIGDSIIADKCLFGDRSLTANLRFDKNIIKVQINNNLLDTGRTKLGAIVGEDSYIGVGSMVMPGIKIGPNTTVGPGIVLCKDAGPDSKIYLKQEYEVRRSKSKKKK